MVWNMQFQICGLLLVLLINGLFWKQKTLAMVTEKVFSIYLLVTTACLTLDILSVLVVNGRNFLPELLINTVAKSYLISIILVGYIILIYTLTDIYRRMSLLSNRLLVFTFPGAAGSIIILFAPIYYQLGNGSVYSYGTCVNATYAVSLFYLLAAFYYIIRYRDKMHTERRSALLFLLACFSAAAVIQFFFNRLLVVGFAMSVGVVFMYLKLENPSDQIDRMTGVFNMQAMLYYLSDLDKQRETYAIVMVTFQKFPFFHKTFGYDNAYRLLCMVAEFLASMPGSKVFRSSKYEFMLLFMETEDMENALDEMEERFSTAFVVAEAEIKLEAGFFYMPDSKIFSSSGEFLEIFRYLSEEHKWETKERRVFCLDGKAVETKKQYAEAKNSLYRVLREDDFEIRYQPVYAIHEEAYTSMEAVVRLCDEKGEVIPSALFLPIAEKEGGIFELGEKALNKVFRFLGGISLSSGGIRSVSLKLSAVLCMRENIDGMIRKFAEQYQIEPSWIRLEIPESAAPYGKVLLDNLTRLSRAGFMLSLYDYGTEESNPNIFLDIPITQVRMNKEFVKQCLTDKAAREKLAFGISAARSVGISTVAEGIDSKEIYETIRELGADFLQGSYVAAELTEKEILPFWEKQENSCESVCAAAPGGSKWER